VHTPRQRRAQPGHGDQDRLSFNRALLRPILVTAAATPPQRSWASSSRGNKGDEQELRAIQTPVAAW